MNQVPNLLDTFANNRKDALAKAGHSADSKSHNQGSNASRDLLPIDPAGKGNGGASAPSSFQAKVKASSAKLAAKAHKFFAQNKPYEAKPENPGPKEKIADRPETNRVKADRQDDSGKSANAGNPKSEAVRKPAARTETARTAPVRQDDDSGTAEAVPRDEAAVAKLKEGLESLGIRATDEQLNDPAFLRDLLQMLQVMPPITDAAIESGDMTAVSPDAALENIAAATVVPGQPAPGTDAKPGGENADPEAATDPDQIALPLSKGVADKEITALIQNRLSELALNPKTAPEAAAAPTAAAPTTTPAQWQGIVVRPRTESITTEPLPMADLDRLRVLQASALQAGTAGKDAIVMPGDGAGETADATLETDDIDPVWASDKGSDAADENGSGNREADHFGRNGDPSRNAEASARKEGPLAAREGATGIQFNSNLEQARSVDGRQSVERAWEPRQPAFEPGVLDQIAKKMSALGRKDGDNISIQLSPDHLGKVRVSLEMKDGAMAARISVENDSVRQQVEAGLAGLKDSLESQGIKLQGLEVSVEQRHDSLFNPDGRNAESFFHRNGRGGKDVNGGQETAPFESAPESDTGRRLGYNTMEFIG